MGDAVLGGLVARNNRQARQHAVDRFLANPRPTADLAWVRAMEASHPAIRAEWDRFVESGRQLPRMEQLIDEDQGNEGAWRAGLLVSRGRPVRPIADHFPVTTAALEDIPGLWSALWSVLDPGTELPEHVGPNAGMLRYHLGVDCGDAAALQVGTVIAPYQDGRSILFDDTVPHAAWNRGDRPRVTLFCEVVRDLDGPARWTNRAVQHLLALDERYRGAPQRAAEWDLALNGPTEAGR